MTYIFVNFKQLIKARYLDIMIDKRSRTPI